MKLINKKAIIHYSVIMLLIIIVIQACKKQLNEGPEGATYGAVFWTSKSSAEQATRAMYGQLRACLRTPGSDDVDFNVPTHFVWGDLVSSNFRYAGGGTFLQYGLTPNNSKPWNFSYVPYWGTLQDWTRFYQVIALANQVIENVQQMPISLFSSEEERSSLIAEALFVRAYTYFYITRIWGDPVYTSKTYNDVDYGNIPPIPRSPEAQVLDSCLRDLSTASALLPYSGGNPVQTIRANKGSAEALKAHIFAWKHEYDSAHFYCESVINNGGYALEPMVSYTNIWKGQVSNESIFELPMNFANSDPNFTDQSSWAEAQFDCFATYLKGPLVDNQRKSCWIAPIGGIVVGIPGGDGGLLFGDSTNQDKRYRTILSYQNAAEKDPAGYMLLKYTNFAYQNPDTKKTPHINNNLVLLRLADIILLNAEALVSLGKTEEARNMLKLTEERAGITSYQSNNNLLSEVLAERGRELIGEGCWFYDLIRTNEKLHWLEIIGYPANRVTPENKGYYWPIAIESLFPNNNLLVQNPWWINNSGR